MADLRDDDARGGGSNARGRGRGQRRDQSAGRGRGSGGGSSEHRSSHAQDKRQRVHHSQRTRAFPRKWTRYAPPLHPDTRVPLAPPTFRVLSFNTLADYLATKDDALATPQGWMYEWSHRSSRLVREIVAQAPHIVCLQEVDHYDDFFEPELRTHGYVGIYKRRTGEETLDGCAIFVKRAHFTIVSSHPIEFFVPEHPVLDRHNVALAAVVEWRSPSTNSSCDAPQRLVIATTHVLFNPKRGDIKLAQLEMLTQRLAELRASEQPADASTASEHVQDGGSDAPAPAPLPVLLCGDFNLEPHSALYHFLSTGALHVSGLNRSTLSGQQGFDDASAQRAKFVNENDASRHFGHGTAQGRFSPQQASRRKVSRDYRIDAAASHSLGFASAYAQSPDATCTGEPKFTIFHSGSKGAVDYLWYAQDALHCHGVLEMVPAGVLFANKALPTAHEASDHLSLVADFSLRAMHA